MLIKGAAALNCKLGAVRIRNQNALFILNGVSTIHQPETVKKHHKTQQYIHIRGWGRKLSACGTGKVHEKTQTQTKGLTNIIRIHSDVQVQISHNAYVKTAKVKKVKVKG